MLTLLLLIAATPTATHPRWFVGDWCYPEGRPLRLTMGVGYLPNERTTYEADGSWDDDGSEGTWRIVGDTLIERRISAESWVLARGEAVRQTWRTRLRRHGHYAVAMSGFRNGWSVKCPIAAPDQD